MRTLVYGAYGFTGERIVREALERELDIVVAGRNGTKTRGLGIELGVESRVFTPEEATAELEDIDVLVNCAGPFAQTYEDLVEACLDAGTSYLDINGELAVFEAIAERDRDAEQAGIFLLSGAGFEVVATDCLACHLHDRLPDATHLQLGVDAEITVSGGTFASLVEHAGTGGRVRREGVIEEESVAARSRQINFGSGPRHAVTAPLGDVSTAYYTTGIENVETYVALPERVAQTLRVTEPLSSLAGITPVKEGLQYLGYSVASSPSERERERDRAFIWGEARTDDETVASRLVTPEPYTLTIDAVTTALERLEAMDSHPTGFETPAVVFDAEFVLELDGVEGFFDEE